MMIAWVLIVVYVHLLRKDYLSPSAGARTDESSTSSLFGRNCFRRNIPSKATRPYLVLGEIFIWPVLSLTYLIKDEALRVFLELNLNNNDNFDDSNKTVTIIIA